MKNPLRQTAKIDYALCHGTRPRNCWSQMRNPMNRKNKISGSRLLQTRRQFMLLAGSAASSSLLSACRSSGGSSSPTSTGSAGNTGCVLTPEQIEGPFHVPMSLVRRDITDNKPGVPLAINISVTEVGSCSPIPNAMVDIWHADAEGLYSSFPNQGENQSIDTSSESFLRGIQSTNENGSVTFDSIYPGWYPGRTTHMHVKVLLDSTTAVTTQLYFPDSISQTVSQSEAYSDRGAPDTPNSQDGFGGGDSGLQMIVSGSVAGYTASINMAINRSA